MAAPSAAALAALLLVAVLRGTRPFRERTIALHRRSGDQPSAATRA